jgi:hypothetical protein
MNLIFRRLIGGRIIHIIKHYAMKAYGRMDVQLHNSGLQYWRRLYVRG